MSNTVDQEPGSATEGDTGPGGQVAVTSQLTQAYRTATPFSVGPAVATTYDVTNGTSELFVLGSAGQVLHIDADPSSDTGWTSSDMRFPGTAKLLAAGTNADGTRVVYVVSSDNVIYSFTYGAPGGWQRYPVGDWALTAPNEIVALKAGADQRGRVLPAVMISWSDSSHPLTYQPLGFLAPDVPATPGPSGADLSRVVSSLGAWPANSLPNGLADVPWAPGAFAYDRTPAMHPRAFIGYPGMLVGQPGLLRVMVWDVDPANPSVAYPPARHDEDDFLQVAAVVSSTGPRLAAIDSNHNLVTLSYVTTDDGTTTHMPSQPLATGPQAAALAIRVNAVDDLDVFALGTDQLLYHVTAPQAFPGDPVPEAVPISQQKFTSVIAGNDPGAFSEAFAVTTDNTIVHLRRETADSDWEIEPVEVSSANTIEEFTAYAVQVLVHDANAVPAVQVPVMITSQGPVDAEINGQTRFLDVDRPWSGTTNSAGVVLINVASTALSVPTLSLTTSLIPGVIIDIDPCAGIQDTLAAATGPSLTAAVVNNSDGTTRPLLGSITSDEMDHLVTALNDTMKIGSPTVAASRPPNHPAFHPLNDARVASVAAVGDARPGRQFDVAGQRPRQFAVDLRDGVVHRSLTPAEHAQLLADLAALPELNSSWSWADLFDAVVDGFARVTQYVVDMATTVADAVSAVVEVMIDGVTYVFNAIVSAAEQLLDLIQEAFKAAKVTFEDLCGWLGNVFNWAAILRTKNMIVGTADVLLDFTEKLVAILADRIHDEIVAYDAAIDPAFQSLLARYGGGSQSLGEIRSAQPAVPTAAAADAHDAMGVNLAHHALINAFDGPAPLAPDGSGAAFVLPPAPVVDPSSPLGGVQSAMQTASDNFQASPSLVAAQSRSDTISGSPTQILDDAVAAVLEMMRELAHAALAGADALVQTLASALEDAIKEIRTLLVTPLPHIPLLSDLYQDAVGSPLTVLDCYALVVAIPATSMHTIVFGEAPFPDQASLDRFTAQITADALLQRTGLVPSAPEGAADAVVPATSASLVQVDPPRPEDGWTTAARVFIGVGLVNSVCFIGIDAFLDNIPPLPPVGKDALGDQSAWTGVAGTLGYASSLVGALSALPWWYSSGPPGGNSAAEFERVLWITQLAPIVVDTCAMIFTRQLARMDGVVGVYIAEGLGVVNLALTITWVSMDLSEETTDLFAPAAALFGAVPPASKILHSYVVAAATDTASLGFLVYLDLVCDALAAGLGVGSAVLAWGEPVTGPPPPHLSQRTTRLAALARTTGTHVAIGGTATP